jgi:hypothetical protein
MLENPHTGGFHKNRGTPSSLDGLFHGKSQNSMEKLSGYPHDLGNPHMEVFMIKKWDKNIGKIPSK